MTDLRQAAQQALEAGLESDNPYIRQLAANAVRKARVQPVQEPTPWRDMVVVSLVREGINKHKARELADHFAAQPVQEPVGEVVEVNNDGFRCEFNRRLAVGAKLYTTPPQQQAEPVAWDKPSASFNEWWDGDRRRDNANPFTTDSFAYWAWEGWQAAQRPWAGLTEEEIARTLGIKTHLLAAIRDARAIEAKLKEKNT